MPGRTHRKEPLVRKSNMAVGKEPGLCCGLRRQGGLKCPVGAISVGIRAVSKFSGSWPQADKGKGVLGQRRQFHEGGGWASRL